MTSSSYDEYMGYTSSISMDQKITPSASVEIPVVKDLMNPEASESLNTEAGYEYSDAQRDQDKPNTHKWHGWAEQDIVGQAGMGGLVRNVLLSGSVGEFKSVKSDTTVETEVLSVRDSAYIKNLYATGGIVKNGLLIAPEDVSSFRYDPSESKVLNGEIEYGLVVENNSYLSNLETDNIAAVSGSFKDLNVDGSAKVTGSLIVSGTTNITGALGVDGPITATTTSVFQKDVYVGGNLFVEGSASYINTDELYVEDKSITVASGAASPEAADGAGFDIAGAGVEFHYNAERDVMTLNKGLDIDGNLTVSGSVTGSSARFVSGSIDNLTSVSASIGDLTSSHISTAYLTASLISASVVTGSFYGDGSGLTGVTMSVSDSPKCKHVFNISQSGQIIEFTHPFKTQNVLVQVYKWKDLGPGEWPEDDDTANWEEEAIQVTDAIITVYPKNDPVDTDLYKVSVSYPEELHGYVVIADAGLYVTRVLTDEGILVSGSGYVDIVEATRNVFWYGKSSDIAQVMPVAPPTSGEAYKSTYYTFTHNLGTKNLNVFVYRYVDETGELEPIIIYPERVVVSPTEISIVFEAGDTSELVGDGEPFFGYIVVTKAGSIVKDFSVDSGDIDKLGIHYGTDKDWSAHQFTAETMSGNIGEFETVDTSRIGNLNKGEQYYYTGSKSVWGSYIDFSDHTIDFHIQPEGGTEDEVPTVASLDNQGNLALAGAVITNRAFALSDAREKQDVRTLFGALDAVKRMRGVRFAWKKSGEQEIGTIAQEIQAIYPELTKVYENLEGEERLTVNYNGLVGVLIEAVKELTGKVDLLENEIERLRNNENR